MNEVVRAPKSDEGVVARPEAEREALRGDGGDRRAVRPPRVAFGGRRRGNEIQRLSPSPDRLAENRR